jgi:predicted Zn-dependent protease
MVLADVEPLEPPDTHYLSAAVGWLGLGNAGEAKAELAQLGQARQNHPDVLEVRWLICAEERQWEEGLQVSRALMFAAPDRSSGWLHQAYAMRRAKEGSIRKAWEALLPAVDLFPAEPVICYNLACYACQLGQPEAARGWLERACVVGTKDQLKRMALADPDLEPLWEEIREW